LLCDLLSAEDRKFIRETIINRGLKLFYRDMVEMNRMPSGMTNHIAVIVTGYGLSATAIYGDDPDNPYLEPFLSGIMIKAKTFLDRTYYKDGSYAEPSGYGEMATRDIVELLATFERNFGVDYSTTTHVENFYEYPLQASYSGGMMQGYGDGGENYSGFSQKYDEYSREHLEWFVKRTANPFLYSYIKPYWEDAEGGYLGYLWYRDDIKPISRTTLPVSKVFGAQGMVMRSGWDDASTVISTRVGPNANHSHYDQGSFQVSTNNTELLTDPGIGYLGYYANLEYQIYNIQAIAHNVMLVDHDPESQTPADYDNGIAALRDWPRVIHSFAGKIADESEADLATVYKNKLKSYTRTLLYIKGGPLFLFDQVKSSSPQGHMFDWLFHAPQNEHNQRSISYSNQQITIDRPQARLTIDVLEPEIASAVIRDRNDKHFPESFVSLSSKPNLTDVHFLAVLLPEAKPVAGDFNYKPKTTRLDSEGWIGARVENQNRLFFGFFRTGAPASVDIEGFSTDAKNFTVSLEADGPVQTIYFEGTSFTGRGLIIHSTTSITCAVSFMKASDEFEVNADSATELSFHFENNFKKVLLDGMIFQNWRYDPVSKMAFLKLPAGKHDITIK
ncbi:MAG TPA: heparinase II/III family protein, partial [Puia sp.]|nr:heparinase II/III family protein [Puia sp.]